MLDINRFLVGEVGNDVLWSYEGDFDLRGLSPSDTVTLNIGGAESAPEPSTLLSLLAVGSLGALVGKGKKS